MLPSSFDFEVELGFQGLPSPALDEIERALNTREKVNSKMEQAFSLIMESMELAPSYTFESFLSNASWYRGIGSKDLAKESEKALDRKLWLNLLEKSRLGVLMNSNQYEEIYIRSKSGAVTLLPIFDKGFLACLSSADINAGKIQILTWKYVNKISEYLVD
jgi:hypothetical protein